MVKYTRDIGLIMAIYDNDIKDYYLYNAHGDVTMRTDTSGSVIKAYDYDAFGMEKNPDYTDANPFRYCGEYFDKETDTYYLRARYYNPRTGRFMTEDPIGDGLNWYTYCAGNPVRFVDPSGMVLELQSAPQRENYKTYKEDKRAYEIAKQEYYRSIEYLKTSEEGKALVEKLENAEEIILITFNFSLKAGYTGSTDGETRTIEWDPRGGLAMSDGESIMSASVALAHEMGHAAQHLDGIYFSFSSGDARHADLLTRYENPIAKQLGEPTRASYRKEKGMRRMNNSTHYVTTMWKDFKKHVIHHNRSPIVGTSIGPG